MIHTQALQISYRASSSLRANRHNARTHSTRQIAQIASSISQFGFTNPILIDDQSQLIAGHARLRAARQLGLESVPTIELKGLSEVEKRALLLADNKIALNAGWDTDLLKIELESLNSIDIHFQLDITGFSAGEIDSIMAPSKTDPDDEVVPATPADTYVKPGDMFQLGPHRVGCGDCRDANFVKALVGPHSHIDAAFLDPPYNVSIKTHANVRNHHREFMMASGEMSEVEFEDFLRSSLFGHPCSAVQSD